MKRVLLLLFFFIGVIFVFSPPLLAQSGTNIIQYEAVVVSEKAISGGKRYEVEIVKGPLKGRRFTTAIESGTQQKGATFTLGEHVVVVYSSEPDGGEIVYIVDRMRTTTLGVLLGVFVLFVIVVGQLKGLRSLLGMAFSFLIIAQFIIPQILLGNDPVLVSLLAAVFILPVLFYLGHGLSKKTTVAMIGTFLSLMLTGLLAYFFVHITRLSGFAAEEAVFLQTIEKGRLDMVSLLLAGIIIGALGVLDDITIAQTALVQKLKQTNNEFGFKALYGHAMEVGRDHIASLVNTLILVYTGASLPLFLLFQNSQSSYWTIINQEIVATEIVRTLVSSIGIIAAVPITTALATYVYTKRN